jgi:hypothetical protein
MGVSRMGFGGCTANGSRPVGESGQSAPDRRLDPDPAIDPQGLGTLEHRGTHAQGRTTKGVRIHDEPRQPFGPGRFGRDRSDLRSESGYHAGCTAALLGTAWRCGAVWR